MQYWLSHSVFNWLPDNDGGRLTDIERMRRPHAIFSHAENVLTASKSEFEIADSILALKRAINSRLQHIEDLYCLSALFPKNVGVLERLEQVGLVRPLLVKQLFELRNDIEHNDAMPPSARRARELVDATWYFLRTTDSVCRITPHSLILRSAPDGTWPPEQHISLDVPKDGSNRFKIHGWVPMNLLSDVELPGSFPLDLERLSSKPTDPPPESSDEIFRWGHLHNSARGDDERTISGHAVLSVAIQREFWRLLFTSL